MKPPPDSRSPVAAAMAVASQITTAAAEMAVPPLLGYWLDRWLGTRFVFAALGAVLGLLVGTMTILRMDFGRKPRDSSPDGPPQEHDAPQSSRSPHAPRR